jgi:phosphate uptake regulator
MVTDLERIGDQAEDIAEIIPFLEGHDMPAHGLLRFRQSQCRKRATPFVPLK